MDNVKVFNYENMFFSKGYSLPIGSVHQIAELSIVQKGEIAEHCQWCNEITYAVSGRARIISGENCTEMKGGQIHFIKKGVKHRIIADDNEKFRYICIGINPSEECREIKSFIDTDIGDYVFLEDDGNLRVLTELLMNEFYFRDNDSDVMINTYLTQILVSLGRIIRLQKNGNRRRKVRDDKTSQYTLYHMLRYIDREYINIKNVAQIVAEMKYNEHYLSHMFKEKMGITVKDYLMRKKIDKARTLLSDTNMKVEEISDYLNFASPHTFYQAFKRLTEYSPTKYKELFKQQILD